MRGAAVIPNFVESSTMPARWRAFSEWLGSVALGACIFSSSAQLSACIPQDSDGRPILVGRIVDEDLVPVGSVELNFSLSVGGHVSSSSKEDLVITSPEGLFWVPLRRETPEGGYRHVSIRAAYWNEESVAQLGAAEAVIDLTEPLPPGEYNLGDVVLVQQGSSKYISRLDDAALERRYDEMTWLSTCNGYHWRWVEGCLLEMAQRGTERWRAFIVAELDRIRSEARERDSAGWLRHEVEYLTALRRAQGKPDPLQVVIPEDKVLEAVFPDIPPFLFGVTNKDVDRGSFSVQEGGDYRSGRFTRCRVEALSPDGRDLPALPRMGFIGGGISTRIELRPGMTIPFRLELSNFIPFASPGDYRIRILYHDTDSIADVETVAGRIFSSSPSFTLRLHAKRVRVTRAELVEMRKWIEEIDASAPIPLVSGHWRPETRFIEEIRGPEDHLFRAGHAAVSVLIDALEEELEPERRAWVLGMLWNITGLHNPTGLENMGVLGSWEWVVNWPTSKESATAAPAELGDHEGVPKVSKQMKLTTKWKKLRPCFEMEIVD